MPTFRDHALGFRRRAAFHLGVDAFGDEVGALVEIHARGLLFHRHPTFHRRLLMRHRLRGRGSSLCCGTTAGRLAAGERQGRSEKERGDERRA